MDWKYTTWLQLSWVLTSCAFLCSTSPAVADWVWVWVWDSLNVTTRLLSSRHKLHKYLVPWPCIRWRRETHVKMKFAACEVSAFNKWLMAVVRYEYGGWNVPAMSDDALLPWARANRRKDTFQVTLDNSINFAMKIHTSPPIEITFMTIIPYAHNQIQVFT